MYTIIGADQKEYGPITEAQILQWISEGRVNGKTLAKVEGGAWKPVGTFPELAAHLPAAAAPGQPPGVPPLEIPGSGREAALNQVNGPAVGLMVTGVLGLLFTLIGVAWQAFGMGSSFGNQFPGMDPQVERILKAMEGSQTISNLLSFVIYGVVVFGAVKMRNLQSYGLSMAASILAMLPCSCSCCAGLPLGIWALVVLAKSEISSQFR